MPHRRPDALARGPRRSSLAGLPRLRPRRPRPPHLEHAAPSLQPRRERPPPLPSSPVTARPRPCSLAASPRSSRLLWMAIAPEPFPVVASPYTAARPRPAPCVLAPDAPLHPPAPLSSLTYRRARVRLRRSPPPAPSPRFPPPTMALPLLDRSSPPFAGPRAQLAGTPAPAPASRPVGCAPAGQRPFGAMPVAG
nr:lysine-rich arabinogalactan protein 19-like [Aegilops tauschii subsp. strangulata]